MLCFAERSSLRNPHGIAGVAGIGFVVCDKFRCLVDELTIDRMLLLSLDGNRYGLVHLIADNYPDSFFSEISFHG